MRTKYLITFLAVAALAFTEVTVLRKVDIRVNAVTASGPRGGQVAEAAVPPYDVRALIKPKQKYLGVTVEGGGDMARVRSFGQKIGKSPNLVAIFESFDDAFAAAQVRQVHESGALAVIRWEPYNVPLRDIAVGKHDAYVRKFATSIRTLNLPIALTFAHEMNGHWYTWGTKNNTASEFVAAWQHLHQIFAEQDARNVIWTWTPNVNNYLRQVPLRPLYPGDAYVDWVGMDGYYAIHGPKTYQKLFGPTIAEIRRFTAKPMIIVETGVERMTRRPDYIENLLSTVATSTDMVGVVYFNINGSGKWNIDEDEASLQEFAIQAKKNIYGFDVRTVR